MSGDSSSPPKSGGMVSLYANLLDPSSTSTPGSISSAPVTYQKPAHEASPEQDDAAKKQQAMAASLRFQPTKRPQLAAQKAKAKAIAAKFAQPPTAASPDAVASPKIQPASENKPTIDSPATSTQAVPKSSLADWAATAEDDEYNAYMEKRQRGGRKKRKKNKGVEEIPQNWDDIYDPSRPNNYEDYKQSEEKIREIREWKDRLYAHRARRRNSSDYDSEEEDRNPRNQKFAPPTAMSFAPPRFDDDHAEPTPPPPPPVELPNDTTGEDAYARRMRLSQNPPPPPPQPSVEDASAPPPAQPAVVPTPTPPAPPSGQISRAPVRYNLPPASADIPSSEAELEAAMEISEKENTPDGETPSLDEPRSLRPGQAGFAERLLMKQGWTKGSGLGANASGIINPLYAKVDKRKKKSDAEGGGYATPAGTGKILGGQKNAKAKQEEMSKFGDMSEVVILKGMLQGMDLDEEMSRGEGGIMQEIGEECGDKYGTVERVYIHRGRDMVKEGGTVFVRFTSQLSGLRAVNALEGRVFNGNPITARFWDREKFDKGFFE